MSIEQTVVGLLQAALTNIEVRYGWAPQGSDEKPAMAPYVVIQRTGSAWSELDTICAMNTELPLVQLQIDCYDYRADNVRVISENVREVMAGLEIPPSLVNELDFFEPDTRLARVSATYDCWDYDPKIVQP